ncbi:hypothetical protein D9M71_842620 [compost metagenome]
MSFGGFCLLRKFFKDFSGQAIRAVFLVNMVLRNRNQVVLQLNLKTQFFGDLTEQLTPVDETAAFGEACAGKYSGPPILNVLHIRSDERFNFG